MDLAFPPLLTTFPGIESSLQCCHHHNDDDDHHHGDHHNDDDDHDHDDHPCMQVPSVWRQCFLIQATSILFLITNTKIFIMIAIIPKFE